MRNKVIASYGKDLTKFSHEAMEGNMKGKLRIEQLASQLSCAQTKYIFWKTFRKEPPPDLHYTQMVQLVSDQIGTADLKALARSFDLEKYLQDRDAYKKEILCGCQ